ncbi:hydroxymethylbilane synthase [Rhizobiaceae bacterium]|nr:hydroxymethylbilane synthase [Rhizobiaceae bacterium]
MTPFSIATRKSTMALAQAHLVAKSLREAVPGLEVALAESKPVGDRDQVSRLQQHGGKGGAFVSEIRADVLAGRSQCAMHSLKDMPGDEESPGLVIAAYMRRDEPTDSLVLRPGLTLAELTADGGKGFRIGTNAVRRAAFLRELYPEIEIIHFRGAADTRIRKLDAGEGQRMPDGSTTEPADAILLATAGMARIGASHRIDMTFDVSDMLPAVGQGIVAVECAETDWQTRDYLARIDDADARACALAEREILWVLNGHCNSPIAGHATLDGDTMKLDAVVLSLDGATILRSSATGEAKRCRELGRDVGLALLAQGAAALIDAARL